MFRDRSLTLFRVRGVPIRAHWTLLLIGVYLVVVLGYQFDGLAELAGTSQQRLVLPPLAWGILLAICVFASILLHELAHTFAAIQFGGSVRAITLMVFGGVSQLTRVPERPSHEAVMAAVGPATSLLLGIACLAIHAATTSWPPDLRVALFYLGSVNVMLGAFNLVPAFPLDGGRILRAALASRMSRARATRISAAIGMACAVALGALGLLSGSLWLAVIAVFIFMGARGEASSERIHGALAGLEVSDVVSHQPPPVIPDDASLVAAARRMHALDRADLLVVDRDGQPVAVVEANDLAAVRPLDRATHSLGWLAERIPRRYVALPTTTAATDAIERAGEASVDRIVVTDVAGAIVGLVEPEDIARAIHLHTLER